MTVYSDGTHLAASTLAELHAVAALLRVSRKWFQDVPGHPHYNLWGSAFKKARKWGCVAFATTGELLEIIRREKWEGWELVGMEEEYEGN